MKMFALLCTLAFHGCGDDSTDNGTSTGTNTATETNTSTDTGSSEFATNIQPILRNSCVGSTCHGTGGQQVMFVENQTLFDNRVAEIKRRINLPASNAQHMPQTGSLSANDLEILNNY